MTALTYAIITLGNTILTGVMSGWLIYFYLPPNGNALVPIGLFGLVVLVSRVSHVTANIIANHRFAPRTTTGWLWHMSGGGFVMAALFGLLWLPPQDANALPHLLLVLVLFNIASGIHQAGYEALLPALAPDEQARGAVSNWRMGFLLLGSILAGLTGPLIQALSYTQAVGIFTLGSAPFLIVPGLLLRHRLSSENPPLERSSFLENVKIAWANPAFRAFACSWGLMWLATTFTFETIPYIVTEICRLSVADAAYFYLVPILVSLVSYPIIGKLTERYGVKTVFRASLLTGAVAAPGLLLINEQIPLPLLVQGLGWLVLQTACLSGAQSIPGAIVAEIIADAPEQQGPLYAFGNLVDQLASGLALAIIPLLMMLGRGTTDPAEALGIRLLGPTGGCFLLIAFLVFGYYNVKKPNKLN